MKRRVVVTGMGVITPNASNADQFFTALRGGRTGIGPIKSFDTTKFRVHIGAEIKELPPQKQKIDRVTQLAMIAAQEALKNGLPLLPVDIIYATLSGAALTFEKHVLNGLQDEDLLAKLTASATTDHLAKSLGLSGRRCTVSNACAAGTTAIALAMDMIRLGKSKAVLTGAAETFNLVTFSGFHALRSLDPIDCRPFDRDRQGLVVGEGAGFLLLEEYQSAKQRGVPVLADLIGAGMSSDAYHETAPDPSGDGARRCMAAALEDADIDGREITYINAHGTGTKQNDIAETRAIRSLFGPRAENIPVSSIKSMIGHLMGAAGAVEAVSSILSIKHSFIPPTINYSEPDPICDLDYVPNIAREQKVESVMSNNFAFGGSNVSLIFRKYRDS
ncbi:hypothetical protein A2625_07580 [candidate division WOR-1 bacterium RIFCSPHIGHO2_01_FULL_53_15]|uniref:Ketosynthase family 3 (KS3) domain-containing protein n=1 Tax=candidate division WOR-1 bacterium RIFCSPHIGHO2_01_FULL_53_15 TaxID=1802564 RepID=A0A1F4Q4D7_UNCSA|nr:MAG: hypothetical protein A2625_07580 [candidate division WOR-1 bacterium RIFCSPHIGHO2_01_FULL_53_15]OGC10566.1 MAG: hypothetical protein A3D23_01585 [candidate division WOR-1 bacterium RIFCSPHIGHO2_02_FULL_53_26]